MKEKRKGVALAETILLIGISLVIVITIFYPIFQNLVSGTLQSLSKWFDLSLVNLGVIGN